MYKLLKVGTDCEVFLRDEHNKPIPVIGLLGGTKKEPLPVLDEPGYAVQEDNVMPEFNIPPADNVTSFVTSIDRMLGYIGNHFAGKGLFIDISASKFFDPEQLQHPQAKVIGCEPDNNVWTMGQNLVDANAAIFKRMRTAAAHVHVSYLIDGKMPNEVASTYTEDFVMVQDLYQGVPSVIFDDDKDRRKAYGRAGAFRFKDYGHEYRVLSNKWLQSSAMMAWVFSQTQECVNALNSGFRIDKKLGNLIQKCINSNNRKLADFLCKEYRIVLP
jgi:hypothetical protein